MKPAATDLALLTLADARTKLRAGEISSRELVESLAQAMASRDEIVGAFLGSNKEEALAAADAADAARRAGDTRPLLGLPFAVKDNLNVRDWPCTCGSRILGDYHALYDASVIAKLRSAGAIPFGRTNMDEFAMGSTTETSARGVTRNPWSSSHVPGGSSGGSAAAVASRMALAALGSDTGGSIRQPASFCGCVGLKPSYGRVSRYGLVAYASSLDQVGPITRNSRDAAAVLQAMAGPDPMDATALDREVPDYEAALTGEVRGVRIGLPREYFVKGLDPAIESATRAAVEQLHRAGAELVELSLPHTPCAVAAYYIIATAEASANLARFDGVRYGARVDADDPITLVSRTRAAGFGGEVKRRIILGTYVLSSGYYDAYYRKAQQARTLIRQDFNAAFEQCDIIAAPVAPSAAFPTGQCAEDPLQMYLSDIFTVPVNLAGVCALSTPCGFTPGGLPIGLQLIGAPFDEARLLRTADAYERMTGIWNRVPPAMEVRT